MAALIESSLPRFASEPSRVDSLARPELARRIALLALLAGELLWLTIRFDAGSMLGDRTWGVEILRYMPLVPRALLAMGSGILIVLVWRRRESRATATTTLATADRGWTWPLLVGQLASFCACFALTRVIFEGNTRSTAAPVALLIAWLGCGAATLIFWACLVRSPRGWALWIRGNAANVVLGSLAGLGAWSLSAMSPYLWKPLSVGTFWLVDAMLRTVYANTLSEPANLVLGVGDGFAVQIAPQCSGFEGIGLIAGLLTFSLWIFRRELSFPRAWLVLPLGVGLIYLANAVRITALIVVGNEISREVALGGFHSQAGWILFNLVSLGLVAWLTQSRWFARRANGEKQEILDMQQTVDVSAAYLMPLLALVATMMVTAAFSAGGFDRAYPARVVMVALTLWSFRRSYVVRRWIWSWTPILIGIAVFLMWMALEPASTWKSLGDSPVASGLKRLPLAWAGVWIAFRVIGSVVAVPIAEELAFRGFLTRWFVSRDVQSVPPGRFTWLSFLASSLMFGALHGRWLAGTLAGMAFAGALYRRGRLTDAVVAHGIANAAIAITVLATGAWSLWL